MLGKGLSVNVYAKTWTVGMGVIHLWRWVNGS